MNKKTIICAVFWGLIFLVLFTGKYVEFQRQEKFRYGNDYAEEENLSYFSGNDGERGYLFVTDENRVIKKEITSRSLGDYTNFVGIDCDDGLYVLAGKILKNRKQGFQVMKFDQSLKMTARTGVFTTKEEVSVTGFCAKKDGFYFSGIENAGEAGLAYKVEKDAPVSVEEEIPTEPVELTGIQKITAPEGRFITLLSFDGAEFLMGLDDGSGLQEQASGSLPELTFKNRMGFLLSTYWKYGLIFLAGILILLLLDVLLRNRRKTVYLAFSLEVFLLCASLLGAGLVYYGKYDQFRSLQKKAGENTLLVLKSTLDIPKKEVMEEASFYESDAYKELLTSFRKYMELPRTSEMFSDLCIVRQGDEKIFVSLSGRNGKNIYEAYGVQLMEVQGDLIRIQDGGTKTGTMLAGIFNPEGYRQIREDYLKTCVAYALLLFLAGSIVVLLILFLQSRDLMKLEEAMKTLATGKIEYQHRNISSNDLENMWSSLYETDKNLKNISYSNNLLTSSYARFLPYGLDKLMRKQSMADLKNGESITLNLPTALHVLDIRSEKEGQVAGTLGTYLTIMENCGKREHAVMLAEENTFETVRMIFPVAESNYVGYGVEFLHEIQGREKLRSSNICVLLLRDTFTCGLVGTPMQSHVFLRAMGGNFLREYVQWLGSLSLKMVITENFLKEEQNGQMEMRYLGFVHSRDTREKVNLYEVLDACSESERRLKLQNREMFDEALSLFFGHDFYLARKKFTEVLKNVPEDKVSKWYLFTCERYLDEEDLQKISCEFKEM